MLLEIPEEIRQGSYREREACHSVAAFQGFYSAALKSVLVSVPLTVDVALTVATVALPTVTVTVVDVDAIWQKDCPSEQYGSRIAAALAGGCGLAY
jgi:hypothetical protein